MTLPSKGIAGQDTRLASDNRYWPNEFGPTKISYLVKFWEILHVYHRRRTNDHSRK